MSRVLAQLLVKFLCAFVLGVASVLGAMHISDFWYLWHQDLAAAISESQTQAWPCSPFPVPLLTVMRWRVEGEAEQFIELCVTISACDYTHVILQFWKETTINTAGSRPFVR